MKKLITICLLIATTFTTYAQDKTSDLIEELNAKIEETSRKAITKNATAYTVNIYFDEEGGHYNYSDSRGGWYLYKWGEYSDMAITTQKRVMLYANDTKSKTYELLTPKSGINGNEIIKLLDKIIYQKTGKSVSIYTAVITDEKDRASSSTQNNYSTYEEPWIMKDEAPLIIGLAGGGIIVALLLLLL